MPDVMKLGWVPIKEHRDNFIKRRIVLTVRPILS